MESKELLSQEFWENALNKMLDWLISEGPSIILIIILLFVSLKLLNIIIRRIKKIFTSRALKSDDAGSQETEKRMNTLLGIIKAIGRIIIWSVFIMILLKKLGADIAPILAGAGILGLAVGFGAQELVRDFISGFFMIMENQIRTGDVVIINGTGGLVEKIELRTVTLRDLSGVVHVFQNGKINTMSNMTKEWSAMVFDIGVAYKEDVDNVMKVMQETGEELMNDSAFKDKIIEPLEIFGLDNFGDSEVVIKARIKTLPIEQWTVGREYRKRLKKAFDEKGIEIPFPHTTVYWGEEIKPLELDVKNS
ncbi:MAG TPA: mechanosensitive ion channel family protein [Bacteroidetes bacterium]|nr:mechanosensitive ion channel family protein [Bacteroidota bacterium]